MAVNDAFGTSNDALGDTNSLIVDGSTTATGAVELTEAGADGDCKVYREVDTAGDGSWATSVLIDKPTGTWHTRENLLLVSQSQNVRFRIKNVSGGPIAVFAAGYEVDN
jgi:hypothetical protein